MATNKAKATNNNNEKQFASLFLVDPVNVKENPDFMKNPQIQKQVPGHT